MPFIKSRFVGRYIKESAWSLKSYKNMYKRDICYMKLP